MTTAVDRPAMRPVDSRGGPLLAPMDDKTAAYPSHAMPVDYKAMYETVLSPPKPDKVSEAVGEVKEKKKEMSPLEKTAKLPSMKRISFGYAAQNKRKSELPQEGEKPERRKKRRMSVPFSG